jgi:nucleoside-triphosphatase THEP1
MLRSGGQPCQGPGFSWKRDCLPKSRLMRDGLEKEILSVVNILNSPDSLLASFFPQKNAKYLVFITGPSGSGKTAFCTKLASLAGEAGLSVGGILCPAVFEGGQKVGIEQLDISSGEQQRLGVRSKGAGKNTIGCWHMDEVVIARGNQAIAGLGNEDVIIIDELGPLELEDGYGYQQALYLLDKERYRTAFVVVRPALLPLTQLRWPHSQVVELERVTV